VERRESKVRALRSHLGFTQHQLSAELGTRISEWETGLYCLRGTSHTILNLISERAGFKYDTASQDKMMDPAQPENDPEDERGSNKTATVF
jgi:transcriptional regulator with XRE-family HTH domain